MAAQKPINKPSKVQNQADRESGKTRTDKTTVEIITKATGKTGRQGKKGKQGRKPNVTVLLDTDELVRDQVTGFVDFLREHAIVGLAVGFVIGAQAQAVVKQLVASFIDPAFKLFFGKALSTRTFTLHFVSHSADFGWGAMIYSMLNLVFVLAAVYVIIKIFSLDKLDKPKQ